MPQQDEEEEEGRVWEVKGYVSPRRKMVRSIKDEPGEQPPGNMEREGTRRTFYA